MTFAIGHVAGGTHAGWKRPLREKPSPWACRCKFLDLIDNFLKVQPGYLTVCPDCGARRDG